MTYSLVDWAASAKFTNMLRKGDQSVVISLYDQDKSKNRIYVSQLLNKLSAIKTRTPYLFTFDDWSATYSDVDFAQLQNLDRKTHRHVRELTVCQCDHPKTILLFSELGSNSEIAADAAVKSKAGAFGEIECAHPVK